MRAAWPALAKARGAVVNIGGIGARTPRSTLTLVINRLSGAQVEVPVICRLDTAEEVSIYEAGGVLQRFAQDFGRGRFADGRGTGHQVGGEAGGPCRVRRDQPAVEVTVEFGGQTDEVRLRQTLELIDEAFEPSTESLADRRDLIAPQGGRRRGRGGVPDEFDLEQAGGGIDGDQAGAETTGDLFAEPIPAETIGETTVFERRGIDAQADERSQAAVRVEVEADGDDLPDRDAIHAHRRAGGDALDGERRAEDEGDERSGPRPPPRESGPQQSRDQHGQHQAAERASAHPAVWG